MLSRSVVSYPYFYFWALRHFPDSISPSLKREMRKELHRTEDPLAASLRAFGLPTLLRCPSAWRHVQKRNNWESVYDFAIIPSADVTDEEMKYLEEEASLPEICSPYDCTGKMFTAYFSWRRTPCGVAVVHCKSMDV